MEQRNPQQKPWNSSPICLAFIYIFSTHIITANYKSYFSITGPINWTAIIIIRCHKHVQRCRQYNSCFFIVCLIIESRVISRDQVFPRQYLLRNFIFTLDIQWTVNSRYVRRCSHRLEHAARRRRRHRLLLLARRQGSCPVDKCRHRHSRLVFLRHWHGHAQASSHHYQPTALQQRSQWNCTDTQVTDNLARTAMVTINLRSVRSNRELW